MLLRFVLPHPHPDTGVEEGIFGAAYDLRDGTLVSGSDRQLLESLLVWFRANLAVPQRFNTSKSKGYCRRKTAGISWLKPTATEHIAKMRELIAILENGYQVPKLRQTGRDTSSSKMTTKSIHPLCRAMDCFATLAMTVFVIPGRTHLRSLRRCEPLRRASKDVLRRRPSRRASQRRNCAAERTSGRRL